MNIIDKITKKKNELAKKMMLLELDARFKELVVILKQKEIIIEQTFLNKPEKQDRDWQDYYASLCLFIEQDVSVVLKMYEPGGHGCKIINPATGAHIRNTVIAHCSQCS